MEVLENAVFMRIAGILSNVNSIRIIRIIRTKTIGRGEDRQERPDAARDQQDGRRGVCGESVLGRGCPSKQKISKVGSPDHKPPQNRTEVVDIHVVKK